jgi:hypothetical protein
MYECLEKIQWKKVLLSGLVYLVAATIIRQIEVVLTMKYYLMPEYFGVWSKLMMPKVGPPPPSFMILSLLFTFITGITLAAFYDFIKSLLPKNCWERVFDFTGTVAVLMLVFSYLPMYLLINLPLGLVVCWFITGLVTVFIGAVVFTKLIK